MSELRKDYFLDKWVIINAKRGQRPQQFVKPAAIKLDGVDYFAPGNENLTPTEIYRVGDEKEWQIRVFPNKFAIVDKAPIALPGDFVNEFAYGTHEVIVENPDITRQLWDLPPEHLVKVLEVYSLRIKEISKDKQIKFVLVFKNHGEKGGTSIIHTHTQVIGLSRIPNDIIEKSGASQKIGRCLYCEIIEKEKKNERLCFENDTMIAFCPWASRFNYEMWIFPKKCIQTMDEFTVKEYTDMADLLNRALTKLKSLDLPYNFFVHYAPAGKKLHMHIEITPRKSTWAGFEIGSGIIVNSVAPEDAAIFYKGA